MVCVYFVAGFCLKNVGKFKMHLSMFSPRGGGERRGRCGAFDQTCPPESGEFDWKVRTMVGRFECAEYKTGTKFVLQLVSNIR